MFYKFGFCKIIFSLYSLSSIYTLLSNKIQTSSLVKTTDNIYSSKTLSYSV